tara:strand:- start:23461 stop:24405 length:945 start_codon:yes stop_codon:yes gene_type:complete
MDIVFEKGIQIPELELWLDSTRKKDVCVVSHAHSDHVARHVTPILTTGTFKLLSGYYAKSDPMVLDYEEEVRFDKYSLTLYPAGHCLGSAQILVTDHLNGTRIVYTGDYKMTPSPVNETSSVIPCDVLIIDSTYGKTRYIFPDESTIIQNATSTLTQWLEGGYRPIIEGWKLGKSQEILFHMLDNGFKVVVEESIYQICKIYESTGITFPGSYRCFEDSWNDDEILLCPPNRTKKLNVKDVKGKRVMRLTGWAIDYASGSAYGRTMMPYSDHADFKQLLNYVGQSGADEIYTVNGFPDLSEYLINLGYRSRHLG